MAENSKKALIDTRCTSPTRSKRPYFPKARTGCLTCKIRRVKCDESKPSCLRCTSTGRRCDGYNDVPRPLIFELCSDPRERRSFDYFRERTAVEISSFRERSFWNRLVLQASYSKAAVRHATVAIGSFHEGLEKDDKALVRFAFEQQSRAIDCLTKVETPLAIEEVLLCCILFIFLENAQCNFDAAVIHLHNGVKIVQDWRAGKSNIRAQPGSVKALIEHDLAPLLDRLSFLASTITIPSQQPKRVSYDSSLPPRFSHIQEAHFYFYQLIHWLCHRLEGYVKYAYADDKLFYEALIPEVATVLEVWLRLLDDLVVRVHNTPCQSHRLEQPCGLNAGILHLKLQYLIIMIMLKCLPYDTEMTFDKYLAEFETIVDYGGRLDDELRMLETAMPPRNPVVCLGFTPRVIPSAYFASSRCHEPIVRRKAQHLLRKMHRREGILHSEVAADLSAKIMEYEEEGLIQPFGAADVPDSRRLHLINETTFVYSEKTGKLELYPRAFRDPEWAKLQCRRSGQNPVKDGYHTLWLNRHGDASKIGPAFPTDVPGLFPQVTCSGTKLWELLNGGAGDRYMGRFSCNTIFSAHSRSNSLHGDFVTLAGELTQYTASES